MDSRFTAFLGFATLIIVTPGPDTALVIRNALRYGSAAASLTALGVGLGSLAWAAAAVLGLAILIERSPLAFMLLKVGGAVYLAYLGGRSLIDSLHPQGGGRPETRPAGDRTANRSSLQQGLFNNLLNPKAGAFFITVLPQFLRPGDPPVRLVLMMAAYEAMVIGWLSAYGVAVSRAGRTVSGPGLHRALHGLTGVVLIGLGVHLLFEAP